MSVLGRHLGDLLIGLKCYKVATLRSARSSEMETSVRDRRTVISGFAASTMVAKRVLASSSPSNWFTPGGNFDNATSDAAFARGYLGQEYNRENFFLGAAPRGRSSKAGLEITISHARSTGTSPGEFFLAPSEER